MKMCDKFTVKVDSARAVLIDFAEKQFGVFLDDLRIKFYLIISSSSSSVMESSMARRMSRKVVVVM